MTTTAEPQSKALESWAILEILGHRRLAGYLTEQQIAGAAFIRIDIPLDGGQTATQFYAPSSVYAIHPCTEEIARATAAARSAAPVNAWELRHILPPPAEATPAPRLCTNCEDQRTIHPSGLCQDCRIEEDDDRG